MIILESAVKEIERDRKVKSRAAGKSGEIGRKTNKPAFFSGAYHGASYYRHEQAAVYINQRSYSPWVKAKLEV